MTYTHQKKPYRAICMQLQPDNYEEVMSFLQQNRVEPSLYGDSIMCRFWTGHINTISIGTWVVVGENNDVKVYSNETFWTKYEVVT
jgi:hypothetical protein